MKLSSRLYLVCAAFLGLMLAIAIPAYIGVRKLDPTTSTLMDLVSAVKGSMRADMMHDALRGDVLRAMLVVKSGSKEFGTPEEIATDLKDHSETFRRALTDANALPLPVDVAAALKEVEPALAAYITAAEDSVQLAFARGEGVDAAWQGFSQAFTVLEDKMEALSDLVEMKAKRTQAEDGQTASGVQWMMVGVSVVGILIGVVLTGLTVRSIIGRLDAEIRRLAAASSTVSDSSGGLARNGTSLAESAAEQAAAIQQTVASMAEMTSMIAQTSENARKSMTSTETVSARTEEGSRTMERMVSSMDAIHQANAQLQEMANIINQISTKTAVINDIVFKTQLLSFNASIEAARAGQHGRGFAVVAAEVGNLAEMSGNAAKDIQGLLVESEKQVSHIVNLTRSRVEEGQSVSKECLEIFTQIAREIHQVSSQVQGINDAAREQETGVSQASTALTQMDQAAQRINGLAQDSSRSSAELASQSEELNDVIARLNAVVYGEGGASATARAVVGRSAHAAARASAILDFQEIAGAAPGAKGREQAARIAQRLNGSHKHGLVNGHGVDANDSSFTPM